MREFKQKEYKLPCGARIVIDNNGGNDGLASISIFPENGSGGVFAMDENDVLRGEFNGRLKFVRLVFETRNVKKLQRILDTLKRKGK